MAGPGIEEIETGITDRLQAMIERGKSMSAYFNRNLFQQYKNAQNARWQTENASQGNKWAPIDPKSRYGRMKPIKYADFPGGGKALMVATSRLSSGALAKDSSYYFKAVTETSFVIGINLSQLPYASHVGAKRPYMSFNKETMDRWRKSIIRYISKNSMDGDL